MLIDLTWHIHGFLSSSAKSVEAKVCVVVLCNLCMYILKDGWGTLLSGELQIWRTPVTRLNSARPHCVLVYNALRRPNMDIENIIDMLKLLYTSWALCIVDTLRHLVVFESSKALSTNFTTSFARYGNSVSLKCYNLDCTLYTPIHKADQP